jgi:ankyrin repeat protein
MALASKKNYKFVISNFVTLHLLFILVELLCQSGCNICSTEEDDPLMTSCQNGDVTIVRTLLKRKANVRVRDNGGKTALHLAAKSSKPTQGMPVLIYNFLCAYVPRDRSHYK